RGGEGRWEGGLAGGDPRGEDDRADRSAKTAKNVRADLHVVDVDPRQARGFLIPADGINVATEPGILEREIGNDQNDQCDDERRRHSRYKLVGEIRESFRQAGHGDSPAQVAPAAPN